MLTWGQPALSEVEGAALGRPGATRSRL